MFIVILVVTVDNLVDISLLLEPLIKAVYLVQMAMHRKTKYLFRIFYKWSIAPRTQKTIPILTTKTIHYSSPI